MKKLFAILLVLTMLSACVGEKPAEKPLDEPPAFSETSTDKFLKDCVYVSLEGKYGVCCGEEVITEDIYDVYKEIGRVGGMTLYAFGKESGTKPTVLYNEDSHPYAVGETEKILWDIYFDSGEAVLPISVDDAEKYDKETLYTSLEGTLYMYTFSDEGEIIEEEKYPAGKTGEVYNGLEEVRYYYGASPLSVGYGLADAEGKTVIPAIYTCFTPIFPDRIIADARNGFGMMNAGNIYDIEGNLLCEKYHMVIYKHMNSETNEWLGIGYVARPESQIESVCRDENGNLMTPGHRFIDKDGNELSEVFTDDIKDEISSKDPIMTLTFADGTVKEVDLTDYVFKP